jgi:hypothetical protein
MPLRLEQVDENHPSVVALLQGPLVLMAISEAQPAFDRSALLRAQPVGNGTADWKATSADGSNVVMRPFMNIDKENYSTYVSLKT